ncbi:class I SAM-dependent methyltransferase [Methanocrinis sp.]|uniref:class I SAM-dependent methyltransferase n=1 Tax=Methanocrinis sp. TaxID=3101522 RepID=UPI003D1303BE
MKEKSTWEEFFDAHAPVYEDNVSTKNTIREVDFLIEELALPPAGSILDVGCGTGRHSIEIAQAAATQSPGWTCPVRCSDGPRRRLRRPGSPSSESAPKPPGSRYPNGTTAPSASSEGAFGLLGAKDDPIGQPLSILSNISRSLKPGAKGPRSGRDRDHDRGPQNRRAIGCVRVVLIIGLSSRPSGAVHERGHLLIRPAPPGGALRLSRRPKRSG